MMLSHISWPRASALPIFFALVPLSQPASAQTADSADATASTAAVQLTAYDCASSSGTSRHVGQVIGGVFHEWIEAVDAANAVRCVSELKPASKQLTRAEAEALLTASQSIGTDGKPSTERAQAASETGESTAGESTGAISFAHDAGVATKVQAMDEAPGDYPPPAILDAGYGTELAPETTASTGSSTTSTEPTLAAHEKAATIGADERTRVGDTSDSPWNTIGQLIVTWRNGTQSICTGTLISPHAVLTAGQCAHDRGRGGFAARTSFAPGQYQSENLGATTQPVAPRFADYVETTSRWTQISGDESIMVTDARADYAVYYFVTPWNHYTTLMGIQYDDMTNPTGNHAGYPTEVAGSKGINQGMWFDSGAETSRSVNMLRGVQVREFNLDASTGSIGGPIWTFDGNNRRLVGIVSFGGDDYAGGVWFGGDNKALLTSWQQWTPSSSAPPNNPSPGLRVPMTFPSTVTIADSYLRFFNPSVIAGKVTLRFADGDTGQHLGTWTSPVLPARSSLQFHVKDIEAAATPVVIPGNRDNYTLTVSSEFQGFFQHVLWNRVGQSLTNLSGCNNGMADDVTNIVNVHSSQIPAYPSVIMVHNLNTKPSNATLVLYDARDGRRLGSIVVPNIPSNASASFSLSEVEGALSITPEANQYHYNLLLEGDFFGYLQHLVYNNAAGLITNMTTKCVMSP